LKLSKIFIKKSRFFFVQNCHVYICFLLTTSSRFFQILFKTFEHPCFPSGIYAERRFIHQHSASLYIIWFSAIWKYDLSKKVAFSHSHISFYGLHKFALAPVLCKSKITMYLQKGNAIYMVYFPVCTIKFIAVSFLGFLLVIIEGKMLRLIELIDLPWFQHNTFIKLQCINSWNQNKP
jgi:hypothetical protein